MKVWVSGSLAYDRVMDYRGRFADHLNLKKVHVVNLSFAVHRLDLSYGGTAGNIAYNLALLKVPAAVVGNLGQDGKDYLQRLRQMGLDLRNVQVLKNRFTAGAYIITDQADNQISGFFAGATLQPNKLPSSNSKDWGVVAADSVPNMMEAVRRFQRTKTRYIFDPGQQMTALSARQLRLGMSRAAVIIGNDYEMDLMLRRSGRHPGSQQIVITTLGEKGSVIAADGRKFKISPAKTNHAVDPTGAGDAYRAGLIYGLISGYSLEVTGRLASVVAAHAVEKYGTQNHRFTRRSVKDRYFKNFKQTL